MGNNNKQMLSGYVAATVCNFSCQVMNWCCYGNNLFWRIPKIHNV